MAPPVQAPTGTIDPDCPEEFRENPLPHDDCSPAADPWLEAGDRFDRLSFNGDLYIPFASTRDELGVRGGLGLVFRPIEHLGLGLQLDTDFSSELNSFLRLESSINLQRHSLWRMTFAGLAGLQHLMGQNVTPNGGGAPQPVTGTLFNAGAEVSVDFQVWPRIWYLSIFLGMQVTPGRTLPSDMEPSRDVEVPFALDGLLGIRTSFNFFPVGE